MPSFGSDSEIIQITSWLRGVGDSVGAGDALVELQGDKVSIELESPVGGLLVEITHDSGAQVSVGTVIGYIEN
jgi:pyruvate/2-oxoglutarate dehydrogenase complex dihydrolipoamide acyltransferase (E2) component